jgi:hypothetical protein
MSATGVRAGSMDGIVMRHHVAMLNKNGKPPYLFPQAIWLTSDVAQEYRPQRVSARVMLPAAQL